VEAQHEDSILLEQTAFDGGEAAPRGTREELPPVHLAVILALCLDVKNSNPKDGLTTVEMRPYVERVLVHEANWTIFSTGLLQRAWLDYESYYSKDRATLQLQALVDQHTTKLTFTQMSQAAIDESSPAQDRLRFLHCIVYPPRWELQRDLARRYQELGVLVSASQLFSELELWDDVVDCYAAMGKRKEARALVQDRRKVAPETPRMLCALGDLTSPPESMENYQKAWDLSGGRYARAKQRLGRQAFDAGDHSSAERHLEDALALVPALTAEWFLLGTVRMRLDKWQEALTAFSTVVRQNADAGDAWGNVGAIHLRLKRPDLALAAFTEGLKANRESWRMWENRILAALQIRPLPNASDAAFSAGQLLDFQAQGIGRGVDPAMLAAIASAALAVEKVSPDEPAPALPADAEDPETVFADRHTARVTHQLLERVVRTTAADPKVWEVCALFQASFGRAQATRDLRTRHLRLLANRPGWEKDPEAIDALADAAESLHDALRRAANAPRVSPEETRSERYSAVMLLKSLVRKAQTSSLGASGDVARGRLQAALRGVEVEE